MGKNNANGKVAWVIVAFSLMFPLAGWWVPRVESRMEESRMGLQRLDELEEKSDDFKTELREFRELLEDVRQRVTRIETKLDAR